VPPVDRHGRIDHKNNASFTGTATPGDAVSLVWDEKPIS
jgi:hypothetical protein